MHEQKLLSVRRRGPRLVTAVLMLSAIMVGAGGAECSDAMRASFRQTATGPIGDGIKTILGGIVDGAVAAVQTTGSSSSSSSSSTSSGNGT